MKRTIPLALLLVACGTIPYQIPDSTPTAFLSFEHEGDVAEYFYLPEANTCRGRQLIGRIGPGFPMKSTSNQYDNLVPADREISIMINLIPAGAPYTDIWCEEIVTLELQEGENYIIHTSKNIGSACRASLEFQGETSMLDLTPC